ncbi:amino acid permease [Longimicrobium sp.]|uniref:amino acid permease n=1 Tax=Longimicrobium sp. TaxID=2029185 RepID=UPI002BE531D6|nr:amino acid permease [Longimicrobium sp.]HSU16534.1 amino acid permease [Longimicrobium sp.]
MPQPPIARDVRDERTAAATASEARAAAADRLPRSLGVWSAAAVLVGSTIGSGIFRIVGGENGVAARVGTVGAMSLLWIVGALVALTGALAIAELATMFPRSGGIYVFIREGYGPLPAFLFGWTELLVIRPSALGAIAVLFAEYAGRFFHYGDLGMRLVAAAAILLLGLANLRSVRWAAAVQDLSTLAKVLAIAGLAVAAFLFARPGQGAFAGPIDWSPTTWTGFGLALVSVMWAYDGWADLTFISGEVKDPARTLPRAIIGGVLGIVAIYIAVNAAYLYVLTVPEMVGSKLVAADTATKVFGAVGSSVVAAMVMVSAFGALNGSMMTGPRIFFAMADDGNFFRPIAAVHPRYRTPYAAILLATALGIAYVSFRTFEQLADAFILGIWPFYALAVGAVYILRRRRPDFPRPYRTWGYPVVPAIFLIASVGMLLNALISDPVVTLICFGVILAGIPVFLVWKGGSRAVPSDS